MLCPKCEKPLQEMWREDWYNAKGDIITSAVGHCDECDFDGLWDINEEDNEINFRQYFFG
jgi:hypothetical protein